jgi:hypothetical protein
MTHSLYTLTKSTIMDWGNWVAAVGLPAQPPPTARLRMMWKGRSKGAQLPHTCKDVAELIPGRSVRLLGNVTKTFEPVLLGDILEQIF